MESFKRGVEMIQSTFGDATFRGERLRLIKTQCWERVSDEAFIEFCEDFCLNARNVPIPNDFIKLAREWRKNYFEKKKVHFSRDGDFYEASYQVIEIDCEECFDIGYVIVKHITEGGYSGLMKCSCKKAFSDGFSIPEWSIAMAANYKKTAPPAEWFKPQINPESDDKQSWLSLTQKVELWQKKKRECERYWGSLGLK